MRPLLLLAASALVLAAGAGRAAAPPDYVAAAVASPERPEADRARDADRKPAQVVAFSGLKPGWKVADLMPGGGYFSRIFAKAVGPSGQVYAVYRAENDKGRPADGSHPFPEAPAVTAVVRPTNDFAAPEPLDLVWISDNYHDLHNPGLYGGPADLAKLNAAVFRALKPGGVYLVIDHAAEPGSGARDAGTLHRIDEKLVKSEVEAAGFVLVGESDALRHPDDSHAMRIFDPAIRGRTDQFVLKFRKPG